MKFTICQPLATRTFASSWISANPFFLEVVRLGPSETRPRVGWRSEGVSDAAGS